MDAELKTYLADVKQAAERIIEVTLDKSFEEFEGDWVVRAAVERQFIIIGEATNVIAAKTHVIPAKAGIQRGKGRRGWPAPPFAGRKGRIWGQNPLSLDGRGLG